MLAGERARASGPTPATPRVPFHVLTGFLGSGKTTVLRALLDGGAQDVAVLVNDVGELGLDHHLLERVDEDLLLLAGGCVCCEVRGELHATLERLLARRPRRVVLETTGLADPGPLLHGLGGDPVLSTRLSLAGVVGVVDCPRIEELATAHPEVRAQLDFADRIVLTKTDRAPERAADVVAWLEREVPGRAVRIADDGRVDPGWLLAPAGFARGAETGAAGARGWLAGAGLAARLHADGDRRGHHPTFTTHAVRHPSPVDAEALQLWLRLVTQLDGPRLLRIKALARCRSTGAVFAFQSVGRAVSPPRRLAVEPPDLPGAELVAIERGMSPAAMERLLESLRGALSS